LEPGNGPWDSHNSQKHNVWLHANLDQATQKIFNFSRDKFFLVTFTKRLQLLLGSQQRKRAKNLERLYVLQLLTDIPQL